jgi:hypothetical protein
MPLEPSGQFEIEQNGSDHYRWNSPIAHQVIDPNRTRSQQHQHARAVVVVGFARGRKHIRFTAGKIDWPLQYASHRLDNVVGRSDQCCSLLDQIIGAGGARVKRRTGYGEHLSSPIGGVVCGDQLSGTVRRFDHGDADRRT